MNQHAHFFRLLASNVRFAVLGYLDEKGSTCVNELVVKAHVPAPSISDQLRCLRQADIVNARKEGLHVFYDLNKSVIENRIRAFWNDLEYYERCDSIKLLLNALFQPSQLMIYKMLANENRLEMLSYLLHHEYSVTELSDLFYLEQPTISMHLAILEKGGILSVKSVSTRRIYSIRKDN